MVRVGAGIIGLQRIRALAGVAAVAALACDQLPPLPALQASAEAEVLPSVGAGGSVQALSPETRDTEPTRVTALGRLQPRDGVRHISGPSGAVPVIAQLRVDKGDRVEAGEILAVLDTEPMRAARVKRLQAELANAQRELNRATSLNSNRVMSDSLRDEWETKVRVIRGEIQEARAELARAYVRSPIDGQVLSVHTREGERVGPEGIVEIGDTDAMFAVAEVYEEDIHRVALGKRARVTSPALAEPLEGAVDWVHLKVAKQDALGTDPAARKDARIVEVEIRLDDSEPAAALTHLQVEIEIER